MIAALAATVLCGCASEDTAGRFLVAPDKYVLYNCAQLSVTVQGIQSRQRELEKLMAKAGTGAGGEIVSDLAYRPEYLLLRGEMNELRKALAEKNCKPVATIEAPVGQTSAQAVH